MSRRIQDLLKVTLDSHETIIEPVMQSDSSIMQLVSPVILMRSRLYELGLQAKDVGGAGDCFFRSVSHQLYGNSNDHMQVRIAAWSSIYERSPREIC